jgi:hypothetical protein
MRNITAYVKQQVFLNYPYDDAYETFSAALSFGVFAAGLVPLSARDITTPDTVRLQNIAHAISNCRYSAHDLSRAHGEGVESLARMNMPLELGMAFYHALSSQYSEHRGAFLVPTANLVHKFASDLAGLDPICYGDNDTKLVVGVYEWLRNVVPNAYFSAQPTPQVVEAYEEFIALSMLIAGVGTAQRSSYFESRELMQRICADRGWWDWRETRAGREEFPSVPIQWIKDPGEVARQSDVLIETSL